MLPKKRLPGFSGAWELKQVSEFGKIVTGGTPKTNVKEYWGEGYPWITPTDISSHRDMFTSERNITQDGLNSIRVLPANTVLVTCIASIGKNAILKRIGGCNQQINAVIPNQENNAEFLYYLFDYGMNYLLANAGKTATNIISKSTFSGLSFNITQLEEQTAIANLLSTWDQAIDNTAKRLHNAEQQKKSLMQDLLTVENGLPRKRLPGFSGVWETRPFADILSGIKAKQFQIQSSEYLVSGNHPVVDQGKNKIIAFSNRSDKVLNCPPGGVIVFGDHTCIVKFIDFDFVIGADGTQILVSKKGHLVRFYAYQLENYGIPTTGYNRHFKFLKERVFYSPQLEEQTAITNLISLVDEKIDNLKKQLSNLKQQKQSLLQQLLA